MITKAELIQLLEEVAKEMVADYEQILLDGGYLTQSKKEGWPDPEKVIECRAMIERLKTEEVQ